MSHCSMDISSKCLNLPKKAELSESERTSYKDDLLFIKFVTKQIMYDCLKKFIF